MLIGIPIFKGLGIATNDLGVLAVAIVAVIIHSLSALVGGKGAYDNFVRVFHKTFALSR